MFSTYFLTIFYCTISSSYINAVCVTMLNTTNNILHSSIESTLSSDTFPHADLLLTYMIIFENLITVTISLFSVAYWISVHSFLENH